MTPEQQTFSIKDKYGAPEDAISCPRCFAIVLADNADKHAEWHRTSGLATFFGGQL